MSGVYQCHLCLRNKSVRLIHLMSQEKILARKLIHKFESKIKLELFPQIPSLACEKCFQKIAFLNYTIYKAVAKQILNVSGQIYHPNLVLPDTSNKKCAYINQCICDESPSKPKDTNDLKEEFHVDQNTHMDTDVENISTNDKSIKTEDRDSTQNCTNDYNCMCIACQNKYGSLPLLLQGIEQKSLHEQDNIESQPSTSHTSSSSKRSLVCEYCSKVFHHKGDFNKHLRKHTKEQPFSCSICDRKFAHTSNLQRHLRLHSGQKPYACQHCHKSFSRKDKLECHKKSKLCQASARVKIE